MSVNTFFVEAETARTRTSVEKPKCGKRPGNRGVSSGASHGTAPTTFRPHYLCPRSDKSPHGRFMGDLSRKESSDIFTAHPLEGSISTVLDGNCFLVDRREIYTCAGDPGACSGLSVGPYVLQDS